MSDTAFPLLPIKPTTEDRELMIKRIISVYESATEDQRVRGMNWYLTAHQIALTISGGDARMGAGVIAALSANKQWEYNIRLAAKAFETGSPSGHFKDALVKAARIMDGEDPETVLPMDLKTGHFFRCIADPTDTDAICLDRHAHDIAAGMRYGDNQRGLSSKGRYAMLAEVYREAARRVGVLPQQLQAVTWVAWSESR